MFDYGKLCTWKDTISVKHGVSSYMLISFTQENAIDLHAMGTSLMVMTMVKGKDKDAV